MGSYAMNIRNLRGPHFLAIVIGYVTTTAAEISTARAPGRSKSGGED
jgi:hypothetical protein